MSDFEETEDQRRLQDIEANEISFVDEPAIRRRFLLTKRLDEDQMRTKIELEDTRDDKEAEDEMPQKNTEKDAAVESDAGGEEAVAQDASQTEGEGEGGDAEKAADPKKVVETASALIPWLMTQQEGADGELKAQLAALLEALGKDGAPAADAAAGDAEKSAGNWQTQLDAINAKLSAVTKAADKEGEETEKASNYVTAEQFDAFATKMASTVGQMAEQMTKVSKRVDDAMSFTPVSKGGDDHEPPTDGVTKANNLFANIIPTHG